MVRTVVRRPRALLRPIETMTLRLFFSRSGCHPAARAGWSGRAAAGHGAAPLPFAPMRMPSEREGPDERICGSKASPHI